MELSKEYLENANEYVTLSGGVSEQQQQHQQGSSIGSRYGGNNKEQRGGGGGSGYKGNKPDLHKQMENNLRGHKLGGREYCIKYNMKDDLGDSKCRDRRCSRAHACTFFTRGEAKPCGDRHPKFEHYSSSVKKDERK